ncbi:MAG TPA: hypothetical protein DDZ83_14605 [Nitrospinae bacterium]|nr:hypothetical protein [Nitrospinota bacterium]
MDERSLQAIEYPRALGLIAERCLSAPAREAAGELRPALDAVSVRRMLDETDEAGILAGQGERMPLTAFEDPAPWFEEVRARGGALEAEWLLEIFSLLTIAAETAKFLEAHRDDLPRLSGWMEGADLIRPLASRIRKTLDERGEVRDGASDALRFARSKIRSLRTEIRRTLERVMSNHSSAIQETLIVQRRERYVVPAKTNFRRSFEGVIQDRSASGETLFVEPMTAGPLNNALADALETEREEVNKILRELSAAAMDGREALAGLTRRLVGLDLIQAKAELGRSWRGERAALSEEGKVTLRGARHPLLAAGVGAVPPERVVPIDISFGGPIRQIIITGPNTGGKTVALKTVGLCVALNQIGVPVPAAAGSALPLVSSLFADIGDEQDIEQNLSTFSGHMTRVAASVPEAGEGSLFLLDELGSGTDPAEGSAIGVAVLEHLARSGALAVVSTHHDALKHYAYEADDAMNASVEFDPQDLSPTYRLRMGASGPSNAMAVAERLELPRKIMERAKALLGGGIVQVDRLMARLSDQESELKENEMKISSRWQRLKSEQTEFERARRREAALRRSETEAFLKQLRRDADDLLGEIRAAGDTEAAKRLAREKIRGLKERADEAFPLPAETEESVAPPFVRLGDTVRLRATGGSGKVRSLHGREMITVEVNGKSLRVAISAIERIEPLPSPETPRVVVTHDLGARSRAFSTELHVRGMRLQDALEKVDKYLDDAAVLGVRNLRIVHGKGEGVLSGAITKFLEDSLLVASYGAARPEEGGWGVTMVEMAHQGASDGGES